MHEFYELKEMLMEEVKKIAKKGELTAGSLETVDKLLNSIKNACKIIMYDEYSDDEGDYSQEGMSNRGGYSNARGRGSNARRDNMGRYSREGGGNSYARGGQGGGGRGGSRGGYSRAGYSYEDGENEEKIEMLREMMQEVGSDEERRALQKIIRRMENE